MSSKDYYKKVLESIKLSVNEDAVDTAFGDVAFGGLPSLYFGGVPRLDSGGGMRSKKLDKILKLQGLAPIKANREDNTEKETTLFNTLDNWLSGPDRETAAALLRFKGLILQAQNKFPGIFKPTTPNGTALYRGLDTISVRLASKLSETSSKDWKELTGKNGNKYWLCTTPVTYTPSRVCQSWSDKFKKASFFARGGLLVTTQTDDFMLSQELLRIMFDGRDESEVIHFGKQYTKKIYVAVLSDNFEDDILPRIRHRERGGGPKREPLRNIANMVKL